MEKDKKPEDKQPDSNEVLQTINSYFAGTKNAEVQAMKNEEMYALLRELEGTEYWIAILRYAQQRLLVCQSALNTIDATKDATAISRNQGAMMGIVDLQNAVIQLVDKAKREAAEQQQQSDSQA